MLLTGLELRRALVVFASELLYFLQIRSRTTRMAQTGLEVDEDAAIAVVDLNDLVSRKVHSEAAKLAAAENSSTVSMRHMVRAIPKAFRDMQIAFEVPNSEEAPDVRREAA
jgi:hypothetical protein